MTKPITTIWLPVLAGILITHPAHGHGTVTSPPSRVYRVYQDLSDGAPNHPATDAAVNHDGGHANAYYTWNQVAKLIPNYASKGSSYAPEIPDGQLASGASGTGLNFSGLDLVDNSWDWPAQEVAAGNLALTWYATATHDPSYFKAWITTADYNHKTPLSWAKMEYLGQRSHTKSGQNYYLDVDLPERSGRHVLYIAWQRIDPAGEAFFSTIDLNFTGGGGGPPSPPAVGTSDVSVVENAGSVSVPVTLSESVPAGETATVDYTTTPISATADSDFTPVTGTLTFQPNQLTQDIPVPILDDAVEEVQESFRVTLSNPQGLDLGISTATVSINDDDSSNPGGFIFEKTADWGGGYQGWLHVINPGPNPWSDPTITFDLPAGQTFSYFGGGTVTEDAPSGSGHFTVTGVGTIAAGEQKSFDLVIQPAPGTNNGPTNVQVNGVALGIIAPSVSIADVAQAEGDTAGQSVTATVSLASAHDESIHVSYTTADGTATAGTDYTAQSGNLEFTPGQTSKTITVNYDGNLISEGAKDFFIVLGAVSGETLPRFADGGSQATMTLTDDDGIIHLTATGGTVVEGDSGTKDLTFRLFLDRAPKPGETVSVDYYTHGHGATKGVDFIGTPGTKTFATGQTTATIDIPIIGDTTDELLERFMLHFENPSGIQFDTFHAVGQIVDNEFTPGGFGGQRVVAYVDGTGGSAAYPPANRVTHICLAFANLGADGNLSGGASGSYPASLKTTNPDIKILLSVGGWTWSGNFGAVAADPTKRATFAASCRAAIEAHNLDGIDLDWEWPGVPGGPGTSPSPQDGHNYTLLLQALRTELDDLELDDGVDRHYEITAYSPAGAGIAELEMAAIEPLFDFLNVQGYDLHGGWDSRTGHQSGLHHNPADPASSELNIEAVLLKYINGGFPKEKLLVGAPFYGQSWGGVPNVNNGAFQPGGGGSTPTYASLVQNKIPNMPRFWDDEAKVPFLYNKTTGEWISYDDPQAVHEKSLYSINEGFGGVFYWQNGGDSPDRQLLTTISDTLTNSDSDGDGLTDAWEHLHFADLTTADGSTNRDGDALTDAQEEIAGTDPNDPASFLGITNLSQPSADLILTIQTGTVACDVQYSPSLQPGSWTTISNGHSTGTFTDTDTGRLALPHGFYRLIIP